MADKILVATKDPQTIDEFSELLKHLSIDVVGIEAPDAAHLLERVRELRPQLILLDVSLPTVSGYELCDSLKESEFPNIPVILLTKQDEPFDEKKMRLSGAESRLMVPVDRARAEQVVTHYIQQSRPIQTLVRTSQETRIVLDLMTHRTVAILYSEIARSFAEHPGFDPQKIQPEEIFELVPSRLKELVTQAEFRMSLASCLLDALPSLLWVEISEQLIEDVRCEISDLGTFEKSIDDLRITVNFISNGVLDARRIPRMKFYAEPETSVAMRVSESVIGRSLLEFAGSQEKAEELLSKSLGRIVISVDEQPETVELDAASRQRRGGHGDWLTLRARAIAQATFYTYLVACGRTLRADKHLEINAIGVFTLEAISSEFAYRGGRAKVVFTASPDLIALLGAHPMARPART